MVSQEIFSWSLGNECHFPLITINDAIRQVDGLPMPALRIRTQGNRGVCTRGWKQIQHQPAYVVDPIIISLAARSCNQLTCQLLLQRESRVEEEKDNEMDLRPHRRVCALLNDLESKKMFVGSNHQISNGLLHFFFLRLIFPRLFSNENFFSGNFLVIFSHFFRFVLISYVSAPRLVYWCSDFMQCTLSTVFSLHSQSRVPAVVDNLHLHPKISRLDRFRYGNLSLTVYHLPIAQLSELSISKRN